MINDKIGIIRKVLEEEDRSIVEEIVMKKSHSTDPSTSSSIQSTPSMIKRAAIIKNSGRFTSSMKS